MFALVRSDCCSGGRGGGSEGKGGREGGREGWAGAEDCKNQLLQVLLRSPHFDVGVT